MKNLFILAFLSFLTFNFSSCSKKDACNSANVASASTELSEVAVRYGNDPSKANCEAYKASLNRYLDVVDNCDFVSEAEVNDARNDLDDLNCQ